MRLGVFVLKDAALDEFIRPFFTHNQNHAIRMFFDIVNDPHSEMGKHPEDFTLYELGAWETTDGKFEQLPQPKRLSRGSDHKALPRKTNGE